MAKKSKTVDFELVLKAKAIRRAEKLERTLTKLTAFHAPGSVAEDALKSVRNLLEQLRKEEISKESNSDRTKKKTKEGTDSQESKPVEIASPSKSPRKAKRQNKTEGLTVVGNT